MKMEDLSSSIKKAGQVPPTYQVLEKDVIEEIRGRMEFRDRNEYPFRTYGGREGMIIEAQDKPSEVHLYDSKYRMRDFLNVGLHETVLYGIEVPLSIVSFSAAAVLGGGCLEMIIGAMAPQALTYAYLRGHKLHSILNCSKETSHAHRIKGPPYSGRRVIERKILDFSDDPG